MQFHIKSRQLSVKYYIIKVITHVIALKMKIKVIIIKLNMTR